MAKVTKVHGTANRLRLDGMLRDFGARLPVPEGTDAGPDAAAVADAGTDAAAVASAGPDAPAGPGHSRHDATVTPDAGRDADAEPDGSAAPTAEETARPETITIGELVDGAAEAGFGFLVAVLSLIAIPFVGLSTPFGLVIALVGLQLLLGRSRPWLPERARRRPLKMAMLDRTLGMVNRRMRWLAASTRKRWQPAITPRLVGLGIVLLGLGLALPLPIPGSNLIFIVPLIVYAIGLLEGDGMWIVLAHVATLVDMALVIVFGATVVAVLAGVWNWIF